MISEGMNEAERIEYIKAFVQKGDEAKTRADKAADKAQQFYAAAGLHLKALREGKSKAAWEKLIKNKCDLGTSRAYELIAIADGRKTVADVRLAGAKRAARHAAAHKAARDGAGSGSSVTNGQNLLAKPEPTATTTKSWKVEVVARDGKRYGNGVRFRTEEEADAYRANASLDLMKENGVIVTATEVIPCDDEPSGATMRRLERGRFKGRFKETVSFLHGTCGTLDWGEIATPASSEKTT